LANNVSLFQDKGYEMQTTEATIRLKDGSASSRTPVQSQGPFGQLQAQGFELTNKGDNVVFLGPATLVLNGTMKADTGKTGAVRP
jgi:lipopolysaccharide export system protein LptC